MIPAFRRNGAVGNSVHPSFPEQSSRVGQSSRRRRNDSLKRSRVETGAGDLDLVVIDPPLVLTEPNTTGTVNTATTVLSNRFEALSSDFPALQTSNAATSLFTFSKNPSTLSVRKEKTVKLKNKVLENVFREPYNTRTRDNKTAASKSKNNVNNQAGSGRA